MRDHTQTITEQYGPVAEAYLSSKVHAQGQDLEDLASFAKSHSGARILDLGCGAGHASFAVAAFARGVTAYDLSSEMLSIVQRVAAERALEHIRIERGRAETLPFGEGSFDIVMTRYSAHHWACIQTVAAQIWRVLKPGGKLVVIDVVTPGSALLTTYMQAIELLRDTSHVRNRSLAEWQTVLEQQRFIPEAPRQWKVEIDFTSWIERMRTPAERVIAIRSLLEAAPSEVLEYFAVKEDGSFVTDAAWIEASKP